MERIFPSYKDIFEETKRRLVGLQKLGEKKTGQLEDEDSFLFLLIGNINLRLNTIFYLLENGITDGVLPLQRTVFELQVAFKVYSSSNQKEKFLKAYFTKKGFESSIKWDRVLNGDGSNLFSDEERKVIKEFKKDYEESIREQTKKSPFKVWYEIASDQSLKEISDEFYTGIEYFASYDELSNWVHPQRLEENLTPDNFSQQLRAEYYELLIGSLMWDVNNLVDDIAYIAKKFKLLKSPRLVKYGNNVEKFSQKLQELSTN